MELNKQVTLSVINEGYGHSGTDTVETSQTVWAFVQPPSMTLRMKTSAANMTVDMIVHLWRHEFEQADYNFIDIDNIRYRIESSNASVNDQFVKLLVSRS